MTAPFRTADGGRVDRKRTVEFRFDGRSYTGAAGDTLASALIANGVHLIGRSFKYHRPRGIVAAGADEPNALVHVRRDDARETPNLRATQVEIYAGLDAASQNRWPSLKWDIQALNGLLSPFIPAGFYYKTLMGPRWLDVTRTWSKWFEPHIRRAAGLGRAPSASDPDTYLNRYAHCDVLVIGAGPAGIAAATSAAATGAEVILCDEQAEPGGSLLSETTATIDGAPAADWATGQLAGLADAGVTVLSRSTAFGYYARNFVAVAERLSEHQADCAPGAPRERLWQIRVREVVIAAGAIERPLVFRNNDRPGIMLADAARTYLNRYGARIGSRAVVVTACDSAYRAALDLHAAGVEIAALCDLREMPPAAVTEPLEAQGIRILRGTAVTDTSGRLRVAGVTTAAVGAVRAAERIACDSVLTCGGWTPSVHLFSQSRGCLDWNADLDAYVPGVARPGQRSAGACRGLDALSEVIADGVAVGAAAAEAAGFARTTPAVPLIANAWSYAGGRIGTTASPGRGSKAFVDFQNDVAVADIELAVREGFRSIEHVKRFTTTGMATDQGKTSNLNALAIVAAATGRSIPEVGLTSFRQPYTPVTFGTLAGSARGELLDPLRRPPSDPWTRARETVYEDVGQWRRAQYFPHPGEDRRAAVSRECRTTRAAVGLLDASTLGKIEVVGSDAREFLARMYVNALGKLQPGHCRYAVLLNEAGFIIDDGIIACLDDGRFHVTTTTGAAARVLALMEDYLQTEWPELDVWLTSITEQWAAIAVQGPQAREVVQRVCHDVDVSAEALPHMGVRELTTLGVPARIFRVSFTGELGFEINVPSGYGLALWQALIGAAEAVGGCAYGTDTMHVLRAEKGYIIVGQETDGTVVPDDVGLGWVIGKNKADFVGKRSLARCDIQRDDRPQLVGLQSVDPERALEEGSQVTSSENPAPGTAALGFVSSAYYSATLERHIALALVRGGRARAGERLFVPMPGGPIRVEVVSPVFYDAEGKRLHG